MKPAVRVAIGVALVVAVVVAVVVLPVSAWLATLLAWVQSAGAAGMVVFAGVYIAAAVFMIPASLMTMGAGFAWGPLVGTLLISPVSVIAATCAFVVGRFLARDFIARRLAGDARFAAIDAAVGQQGLKIVILLRLSPVLPFGLLNYGLGLTRVRHRDFVLGSWLGMLPGTVLYVYLGSLITSVTSLLSGERPEAGPAGLALLVVGLVATVTVTVVITRLARRALAATLASASSSSSSARSSTASSSSLETAGSP